MAVTGPVAISEKFASVCSPVIGSTYDTCGTVTRATINHLDLSQLNSLFAPGGLFADLDAWFVHAIEMKACGTRRYVLYDWIMANADRTLYRSAVSGIKAVKGPSLMHPFIMGRTKSVVSRGHWKIITGFAATSGAYTASNGANVLTAAQRDIANLTTGADKYIIRVQAKHDIPSDANWWRTRDSVHIFSRSGAGVLEHGHWRVLAAAAAADLTYVDVVIESNNGGSTEAFDATPQSGYVIPGVNNVNDFEYWCQNLPTINPKKMVPFWIQTMRTSRCVDSEYRKVYRRLYDSNPAFREFGDLELAERNKQDEQENQMRFVNDFFYNKPISAAQDLSTWQDLDDIETVETAGLVTGLGGKLIGKRANFEGVRHQLHKCDRVIDVGNAPLNLEEFFQYNYDIKRARESSGRKVTRLDWWTSEQYKAIFFDGMLAWYKLNYQDMLRVVYNLDQSNDNLGVVFDTYKVKFPSGLEIAIMSNEYFDDRRNEFSESGMDAAAGNLLLCLDIGKPGSGTIYWAQIASKRKVHTTADIDALAKVDSTYRCVMDAVSIEQTLKSDTGTAVVECPLESLWIEGFNDARPTATGKVYPYTDLV